jgi:hypothetical protein
MTSWVVTFPASYIYIYIYIYSGRYVGVTGQEPVRTSECLPLSASDLLGSSAFTLPARLPGMHLGRDT